MDTTSPPIRRIEHSREKTNIVDLRRLTRVDIFRLLSVFCFRNHYSISLSPLRRNVSARISLRGLRRLIWVDTLRRGHYVGFLAGLCSFCSGRDINTFWQSDKFFSMTSFYLLSHCFSITNIKGFYFHLMPKYCIPNISAE